MERLTHRDKDGFAHANRVGYDDLIEKLCEYEQAEEDGIEEAIIVVSDVVKGKNEKIFMDIHTYKVLSESMEVIIKSLEELVAYREIGTVEECKEAVLNIEHYYMLGRNKAIDEAIEASAKAICIGCGYLDGHKCKYKGTNCSVSKPMLKVVVEALEQMKRGK